MADSVRDAEHHQPPATVGVVQSEDGFATEDDLDDLLTAHLMAGDVSFVRLVPQELRHLRIPIVSQMYFTICDVSGPSDAPRPVGPFWQNSAGAVRPALPTFLL